MIAIRKLRALTMTVHNKIQNWMHWLVKITVILTVAGQSKAEMFHKEDCTRNTPRQGNMYLNRLNLADLIVRYENILGCQNYRCLSRCKNE